MDAETARELGRLETTVANLVVTVDRQTVLLTELRDLSIQGRGVWSALSLGGNIAAGVAGALFSALGAPALAALTPLLHVSR